MDHAVQPRDGLGRALSLQGNHVADGTRAPDGLRAPLRPQTLMGPTMTLGTILAEMIPYDLARDPAGVRQREMIAALRDHADALRSSCLQSDPNDREGPSGVRLVEPDTASASGDVLVSQETCERTLGLKRRTFLELLRRPDAPPSSSIGKGRLVRRDAMVAFIERLGAKVRERVGEGHEVDGADAVLAEIGCAPVRGRR